MIFAGGRDDSELRLQLRRELISGISFNGETAAGGRPVVCERCDKYVTSDAYGAAQLDLIGGALALLRQKMEDRPVVPEKIEVGAKRGGENIGLDPIHPRLARSKAGSAEIQCRPRQIEQRDTCVASVEKIINEGRCTRSNVDDRAG